jgi:adenylate cyclase
MDVAEKQPESSRYRAHDLEVDVARQSVRRQGRQLALPDLSMRLLAVLVERAPDNVSKDDLIGAVWGDVVVSDETLAQRIRLLRQALDEDSKNPRYISSVRGRGYRMNCTVTPLDGAISGRSKQLRWAAGTAVLLTLGVAWLSAVSDPEEPPALVRNAVAVLPFVDLSAEQNQRYFADGIQEELLTRLTKLENLEVSSRTTVEAYRSTRLSLTKIGEQLGVNFIIEGSVRITDNQVRITVQLIDAVTDRHLWAENFDRTLSVQNIFLIQDEVADRIADALELEYTVNKEPDEVQLPTANIEAYNAYLLGRYHTFKQTRKDLDLAVTYLRQATRIDPEFAEAYAALGWAYSFLGTSYGGRLPSTVYPQAKEAAIRALALNSELADARSLYADILAWYDWDFVAAEREYLKTIAIEPLNALGYSLFLSTQNRHEEAIARIEKVIEAYPADTYVHVNAAWRYLNARQYERAIAEALLAGHRTDARAVLGLAYLATGRPERAVEELEADLNDAKSDPQRQASLASAYFKTGREIEAKKMLGDLRVAVASGEVSSGIIAEVYFAHGDTDNGFEALQQAFDERAREVIFVQVSHSLDGYRDDPRYREFIQAVGFLP